jgi:acyl-CoA synthetase (AMP-forming)/AMP-acid ligase II
VGANARVVIVERFTAQGRAWVNPVTELVLGPGAQVEYVRLQAQGAETVHTSAVFARLDRDATLVTHEYACGAALTRAVGALASSDTGNDELAAMIEARRAHGLAREGRLGEARTTLDEALARTRGLDAVPVVELVPGAVAGEFTLEGGTPGAAARPGAAEAEDVALVLHTSGTTARPKIVPLTHTNVTSSAGNIARTLRLGAEDACLNVMPLFHIHGLIAATLASLAGGGAVICTGGFNALRFFGLLDAERPSWYTAVPTMHQTILARAERNAEIIVRAPLRFIRSSSASLPAQAMKDLAAVFGAPVIESYGMTEASHQMCSNPLPPGAQKPGIVGLPAGPEVAIMDDDGSILPQGEIGEVVIRGPNVTKGYEANPEANAKAFTNGWFRTGDQGMFDADGYLCLTGRLKELIKRGGEQVSPLEVDGVLSEHPAVAQALTFSIPHAMLGEEVGAAVVLRDGMAVTERELRDFAALHLADFKVPRKVVFLEEIPKGATGKLMRIGLAEKLGLTG